MPLPNLIHRTNVTVQQIDRGATIYDEETREPVQQAERKVDTIVPGQILWGKQNSLSLMAGGAEQASEGYVLFRYVDLRSKSMTLQQNDRFIKMGHLDTDVYIVKLQPMGHYADQNGPALVRAYFASRQPSRQGQGL